MRINRIFGQGLALAIPLAVVGYIFIRVLAVLEKTIGPVASKMGIDRIWGELTLTLFCMCYNCRRDIIPWTTHANSPGFATYRYDGRRDREIHTFDQLVKTHG